MPHGYYLKIIVDCTHFYLLFHNNAIPCVPVAQLVEHRAAMREVVSSTTAGPTLRVFNK